MSLLMSSIGSFKKSLAASEERAIAAFLVRSTGAPLTILVRVKVPMHLLFFESMTSPLNPLRSLRKLAATSDRWKSIHLSFSRSLLVEPLLAALAKPNRCAEELFIDCSAFRDAESKAPSFPFVPALPNLRSINFTSHDSQGFSEWSSVLPLLTRLEVNAMVPFTDFIAWVKHCPGVEVPSHASSQTAFTLILVTCQSLTLKKVFLKETLLNDVVPYKLVPLDQLKSLQINFVIANLDVDLAKEILDGTMRSIYAPALEVLALNLGGTARFGSFASVVALLTAAEPPLESLSLTGFEFNPGIPDDARALQTLHLLTPRLRTIRLDLDVARETCLERRTDEPQIASSWDRLRVLQAVITVNGPIATSLMPFGLDATGLILFQRTSRSLQQISVHVIRKSATDDRKICALLDRDARVLACRDAGIVVQLVLGNARDTSFLACVEL